MRLVDADALEKRMEARLKSLREQFGNYDHYTDGFEEGCVAVEDAETIDPESLRPTGEWIEYDCYCCNSDGEPVVKTGTVFVCSECGREERYKEPYCHCGAKMKGESECSS